MIFKGAIEKNNALTPARETDMEHKCMSHYKWIENKTLILNLHVIPGAQKSSFAGVYNGSLRIRLNAQPRENEANDMLIQFLAKTFDTPKSQITLISGSKSRLKRVSVVNPKTLPLEAQIIAKEQLP